MVNISQVLKVDNLFAAWLKVNENQGCAGVDGQSLAKFENNLTANLDLLRSEVMQGSYQPRPLLRIYMQKTPDKVRPLSIPAVRDRVLQTAVTLTITPIFEKEFEKCSFAYRKGYSVKQAIQQVIQYREQGFNWVVDADIESFFDEINHHLMLKKVMALVTDGDILRLINLWLKCVIREGNEYTQLTKGVPQGSPISPLLSNLYLDELDETLIKNNQRLVRFADDFLVLCKTEKRANKALELTEKVLEDLKLNMNEDKTQIVSFNHGFRFLGVDFIRSLAFKSVDDEVVFPEQIRKAISPTVQKNDVFSEPDFSNEFTLAFQEAVEDLPNEQTVDDYSENLTAYTPAANIEQTASLEQTEETSLDAFADETSSGHDPLLRTLYLMEHGCVLSKESKRLVIEKNSQKITEIPAIKVDQVLIYGNSKITTPAMNYCLTENILIVLLSSRGKFFGIIDSHNTESVLLHQAQFKRAEDDAFCLQQAKAMVTGKLANSRVVLLRQARKRNNDEIQVALDSIKQAIEKIDSVKTLDEVRGHEGQSAKVYFAAMGALLAETWKFTKRIRQPPPDPINALLSFGYTLLFYNIYSLMKARGVNPHIGFLHPIRQGHPAFVSDLMEEFRPIIVDALVLSLLLNQQLKPDQFSKSNSDGGCYLTADARKLFVKSFEKKMNTALIHPINGLRLDYRRCIDTQIRSMASVIRGHVDTYQAMVLR